MFVTISLWLFPELANAPRQCKSSIHVSKMPKSDNHFHVRISYLNVIFLQFQTLFLCFSHTSTNKNRL